MKNKIYMTRLLVGIIGMFLSFFYVYLRPIHQDDGWYASFAYDFLMNQGFNNIKFTFNSTFPEVPGSKSGWIYTLIQSIFIIVFGSSVLYTKILAFVLSCLFVVFFLRILEILKIKTLTKTICLLFLFSPVYYYHLYNRPELLACTIILFMYSNIFKRRVEQENEKLGFWEAFVFWVLLDIHPISIIIWTAICLHYFVYSGVDLAKSIVGLFSGIMVYILGNYYVNDDFGFFAGNAALGDHFIPLLSMSFKDFPHLFLSKYYVFIPFITGLFLIAFLKIGNAKFVLKKIALFVIAFLGGGLLLTEAISNGFQLYNLTFIILLIVELYILRSSALYFYFSLLFTSLLTYRNLPTYRINYSSQSTYDLRYKQFVAKIDPGSSVMMRPVFAFGLADKNIKSYYIYNMLFLKTDLVHMKDILARYDIDYLIIDDTMEKSITGIQKEVWYGANPMYNNRPALGFEIDEIEGMVKEDLLELESVFEDPSHGRTRLYKVKL